MQLRRDQSGSQKRLWPLALAITFLWLLPGGSARDSQAETTPPSAPKALALYGSFVHDVGNLGLNVTNWGLIGSKPGLGAPYSDAPSGEWPAGSGVQYLWAGGLWVGAIDGGVPRVSTGQYETEILADPDDPLDTIYRQHPGAAGSERYPSPGADDDGDGLEDEDPINGLDDDGDGEIDEDAGGIGDQHFRAVMRDDEALATDIYPDHSPLGIEVVQQSFQWADPAADDFVGFRFTVRNVGDGLLEQVFVGFFMDADVASAEDDLPLFLNTTRMAPDGTEVPVQLAGTYDADLDGGAAPGALAVQILDHPTDPTGVEAPAEVGMTGFQLFAGNLPFSSGGDPANDAERYELLSHAEFDDAPPLFDESRANDYRVLVSVGPFASLGPGEELVLDLALVAGEVSGGLVENAANAWLTHRGQRFDRDGDPTTGPDGREFEVNWLRTPETPIPAFVGELRARRLDGTAGLEAELNLDLLDLVRVRREARADLPERIWRGTDVQSRRGDGGGVILSLRDDDPGGWPRLYRLEAQTESEVLLLDQLEIPDPKSADLDLEASPNPFNPRVVLSWTQPRAGEARLRILDVRGRVVRHLDAGPRSAGGHEMVWDGVDDAGRLVASGAYHAEIRLDGQRRSVRLALVR